MPQDLERLDVISMPELLLRHGVLVLFVWAFVVQAGVPVPAIPMLLGAGVLSGSGQMHLALAVAAAMAATLGADVVWYALGRALGSRVLGTLCRFSLNPDSLVRDAKERFVAHRVRYVVLAKFLPGLNPLAAGLAGVVPIRLDRLVLYATAGAFLWAGVWITLGDVVFKYGRRQRSLRHLRMDIETAPHGISGSVPDRSRNAAAPRPPDSARQRGGLPLR